MKKFLNNPDFYVDESIEGILAAHGDQLTMVEGRKRVIGRKNLERTGRVGLVTGGGSGHLPLFLGYVGQGMMDACAVGNVFASPSAEAMYHAIRYADQGAGVICLFGNYGGDSMNFQMACEMAEMDGIVCRMIRVSDDVASASVEQKATRRGVAGLIPAYKVAGAAAEKGLSLDEVERVVQKALDAMLSLGVAVAPCTLPQVGKPNFSIGEDELEVGMGIHGEPGISICRMMSADDTADLLVDKIDAEMRLQTGEEVLAEINGLGATPLEEMYIVFRRVHQLLDIRGVRIYKAYLGELATSMEMGGFSLTLMRLDQELTEMIAYPASTPFFTNSNL